MPQTIQFRQTETGFRFCPCIVCDHCGEHIKKASGAIVDYHSSSSEGEFSSDLRFYHVGECAMSEEHRLSMMLDHYLSLQAHNSGFEEREFFDF